MRRIFISLSFIMLLFSCGKQQKAESVVKDFLDENLVVSDYSISFAGIDSTSYITDSIVGVMKKAASTNRLFKKSIKYGESNVQGKYIYTRAEIVNGKDTVTQTFYLDKEMTCVIAFK